MAWSLLEHYPIALKAEKDVEDAVTPETKRMRRRRRDRIRKVERIKRLAEKTKMQRSSRLPHSMLVGGRQTTDRSEWATVCRRTVR